MARKRIFRRPPSSHLLNETNANLNLFNEVWNTRSQWALSPTRWWRPSGWPWLSCTSALSPDGGTKISKSDWSSTYLRADRCWNQNYVSKVFATQIFKETILDKPECLPGLQDMMEAVSKSGNEINQSRIFPHPPPLGMSRCWKIYFHLCMLSEVWSPYGGELALNWYELKRLTWEGRQWCQLQG